MSHYTRFTFQYTDLDCILSAGERLGLSFAQKKIRENGGTKWLVEDFPSLTSGRAKTVWAAKNNGFNYFFEKKDNYYELSIETNNMTAANRKKTIELAREFKSMYVEEVAKFFVSKMNEQGINALIDKVDNGLSIQFGATYEKSILIKFDNGRVVEEVHGVKGGNCTSITETLEKMLSSSDTELNRDWNEEFYEPPEGGLTIYNLNES